MIMISTFFQSSFKLLSKTIKRLNISTMSEQNKREPIYNFAFIDLETTGLPSMEHNRTKITELSISIVESNHLCLGVFPRVLNKLNLCFNPCKFISPDSTDITGLSNDLLENQSAFSLKIVDTINNFLNLRKQPICFVAHNGYKFDFPILRAEMDRVNGKFSEDILCIDSLLCFQNLHQSETVSPNNPENSLNEEVDSPAPKKLKTAPEIPLEFTDGFDELLCKAVDEYDESIKMQNMQKKNETTPQKPIKSRMHLQLESKRKYSTTKKERVSFKLEDIYRRLTSKTPESSHQAEGDVNSLIHCAAIYGEKFVIWANENAKPFQSIPAMKPGTRIGC